MITNFEEVTEQLTKEEIKLLPVLIAGFKNHKADNPIRADEIVRRINATKHLSITPPRLRKLCNFIRARGMLPLIATSKGYYVSYDREEIRKQIQSLEERAGGIMAAADGLKKFTQ